MADLIGLMVEPRPPARKRRRIVISCFECHRRKQKVQNPPTRFVIYLTIRVSPRKTSLTCPRLFVAVIQCDRELPCGNCVTRNREASCAYEAGAPTSKSLKESTCVDDSQRTQSPPRGMAGGRPAGRGSTDDPTLTSMAAALGYSQTRPSTMSLLRTIETADQQPGGGRRPGGASLQLLGTHQSELAPIREKYKSLVRQLPAKTYIDRLVGMYFADLHQQYNFVDQAIFFEQLAEWDQLPFALLSSPEALRPAMRFFPALLFQILATALLLLPPGTPDPVFDALKYAGGMTFEDLATDYSDSGAAIVNLFGKSALDEVTVQAQFIRALFQKYTAHVIECWHGIAAAIRDAQELGMHRDALDPKPEDSSVESILKNQWRILHRRKMYMMLVSWDINMAVFLGRPGSVVWAHGLPSLPVDAPAPTDCSKTPIESRDEAVDPPTLITRQLFLFKLANAVRFVLDLEPDGSHPKDFSKVDHVHRLMDALRAEVPPAFRLENPDRRWDAHPACSGWIRQTRLYLRQLHHFGVMALHRPYIFHRRASRAAALRAAVDMLGVQRQTFDGLPLVQWRSFHLFFGSFDAVVVVASIFILFPRESPALRDSAARRLHWTIAKFEAIREHNAVARAAQGVLTAIRSRFVKAVGEGGATTSPDAEGEVTPGSDKAATGPATVASGGGSSGASTNGLSLDISPSDGSSSAAEPWGETGTGADGAGAWVLPEGSLSSLAPIYPTSDLLFNDLVAKYGDSNPANCALDPVDAQQQLSGDGFGSLYQFDGDFAADNTFWQFMNQFNPDFTG
ncbi:Fungal transcriptional regulatory protein [Cordyceps fumosorosea ARSEF 2679]|uniref:Fungal transcriptional regulatory protein n=1 Tax=Cordyceps fumosorosea (strain ARSEF 2679) TaxID=1081104 RepID=A0A167MZG1_CORFA|nr:Fungal transcriptional regulatory protein [Cordyceps fumosorosea ARSEF 2679]OAA54944.1 Fungal transcriptional regulatory protein [Cordyceps fumosorosea ARSEF 2679]